jgi:RNA 2',3'-cyclic 3'-phosphodiesterase
LPARLFVALEVGGEDRRALAAWAREAVAADRALRIVAAEQVHLTLAFLGHRPLADVGPLSAVVEALAGWPLPVLSTGAALWLAPRRPHVLTVAVSDDTGALAALHATLWDALEEVGFEREERRLRPHLTVARVRRGWTPSTEALPPTPALELDVRGVALMRSWLGDGQPRYEALTRAEFGPES